MLIHIVTNHGTMDNAVKYEDSIKVFKDEQAALTQFKAWRGPDPMSDAFGFTPKLGSKLIYKSGDIDVELFTTTLS